MSNINAECSRLFQNTINIKSVAMGQSMEEIKKEVEYKRDKVQVILQFPETSEGTAQIKNDVKEILKRELQKQMKDGKGVV